MGIGVSLILIAVGLVLWLAVTATVSGVAISTVGIILVAVGALGLLISLVALRGDPVDTREVVERRDRNY